MLLLILLPRTYNKQHIRLVYYTTTTAYQHLLQQQHTPNYYYCTTYKLILQLQHTPYILLATICVCVFTGWTCALQLLLLLKRHYSYIPTKYTMTFGRHVRPFTKAAVAVEQQKLHNHHTNRQNNGVVAVVAFVCK